MIIANIIRGIPFMPLFVINIFKANANIAVKPRILLLGNPIATPFAIAVQIIAAKKTDIIFIFKRILKTHNLIFIRISI